MMEPIVEIITHTINAKIEDEVYQATQRLHVTVNKERLIQALNDARAFYDEGYKAGRRDALDEDREYECPVCGCEMRKKGYDA